MENGFVVPANCFVGREVTKHSRAFPAGTVLFILYNGHKSPYFDAFFDGTDTTTIL